MSVFQHALCATCMRVALRQVSPTHDNACGKEGLNQCVQADRMIAEGCSAIYSSRVPRFFAFV